VFFVCFVPNKINPKCDFGLCSIMLCINPCCFVGEGEGGEGEEGGRGRKGEKEGEEKNKKTGQEEETWRALLASMMRGEGPEIMVFPTSNTTINPSSGLGGILFFSFLGFERKPPRVAHQHLIRFREDLLSKSKEFIIRIR